MEIHLWDKSFEDFLAWWETLEAAGLRPFWTEPNLVYLIYNKKGTPDLAEVGLFYQNTIFKHETERKRQYSFLNVIGDNIFIKDPPKPPSNDQHPHGSA